MVRIALKVEYHGAPFAGWQRQADQPSVQGAIEAALASWATCGMSSEIIARASEGVPFNKWKSAPRRVCLPNAPAPSSSVLEKAYYPTVQDVINAVHQCL